MTLNLAFDPESEIEEAANEINFMADLLHIGATLHHFSNGELVMEYPDGCYQTIRISKIRKLLANLDCFVPVSRGPQHD